MFRSVLSVLAGIAALTGTSFAVEAAVDPLLLHLFPQALPGREALASNPWVRTLTFAYGFACVAAGGYIAASVARRLQFQHAAAMGVVQAGLTIGAMLSPVANHASRWQWITSAIVAIPAAIAGGAVYQSRKSDERLEKASASI
jgi:hypothetical protein